MARLLHLLITIIFSLISISNATKRTFIVLVDSDAKPSPFITLNHWYTSLISSSSSSSNGTVSADFNHYSNSSPFIHVYEILFNGFSATLTLNQAEQIEKSIGILAVYSDSVLHLHTTRSPAFLGLDRPSARLSKLSDQGSGTIIGIIDTGIWPESQSFADHDHGPVPNHWKGECQEGLRFNRSNCNRKLIGARFFSGGYEASLPGPINEKLEFLSPRDSDGHGTHVASIAAGSRVSGADFQGFAGGVGRGMAPKSRIAVYKVCWISGCLLSDVCAALEKAVTDGVDILSVSLGASSSVPFYLDLFAIASFRATVNGVLVAVSAGNEGPRSGSITNSPPWILTVGAGTIDRDFPSIVSLGNGEIVNGISLTPQNQFSGNHHSLYFAGKITTPFNLSHEAINGRIVLCMVDRHVSRISLGASLKYAGASAMIISHGELDPRGVIAEPHVIPSIAVAVSEAELIKRYITRSKDPTAVIFSKGTKINHVKPAPTVASFSSRGPNLAVPTILKPDILAPGVNVLGAWTDAIAPSNIKSDIRRSKFNILSGTSMACPHVSGVAALIKAAHPGLNPSEIKSALMTTASTRTNRYDKGRYMQISDEYSGSVASPFDIGAGHLRAEKALFPGLVYDLRYEDYVNFLCGLNYMAKQIKIITGKHPLCSGSGKGDLNYPGFAVVAEEVGFGEVVYVRRLKKVGEGSGVYSANVVAPEGFRVYVEPEKLRFSGNGERVEFKMVIRRVMRKKGGGGFSYSKRDLSVGALTWTDEEGKHVVRSPIVVFCSDNLLGFENLS